MRRLIGFLLPVLLSVSAHAGPKVVASIPPLHSLVAAVAEGVTEPHLLVRGGTSPHAYALRPSDMRALAEADVVFWIGPQLESFLPKPLGSAKVHSVAVTELDGVQLLASADEGGPAHADERAHGHDHDEDIDPHVWLDPANAAAAVQAVAATLERLDPGNAARYRANRQRTLDRLTNLEQEMRRQLAPVQATPYVVFHDGYRYLESRLGLNGVGAVTLSPERRPGARRIAEIRDTVRALRARCVFAEPQFRPALVKVVLEDTGARYGVLDPLGSDLEPGPDLYFRLMENLATSMHDCLGGQE